MTGLRRSIFLLFTATSSLLADGGDWSQLIENLPKNQSIEADFKELRTSPLRKRPSVLSGTLRYSAEHGLSLQYIEPFKRVIFIKGDSIELRDADDGSARTLPDDERYSWIPELIGTIFTFELDRWQSVFALQDYSASASSWEATLEPTTASSRDQIRLLKIIGDGTYIQSMELKLKGGRGVNIEVLEASIDPTFDADTLALYF